MTPADIATVRELIAYARANGWTHYMFPGTVGGTDGAEHLWRHDRGTYDRHSAKVSLWEGGLSYYERDNRDAIATLPARSAAMVADWLRLLGLIPTVAQVAEAMLSDRAAEAILDLVDMQRTGLLRESEPNRRPDWYIAQQGAEAAMHRMDESS